MSQSTEKKLGFYISFKKSEKDLYNKVKNTNNYSTLIKELLENYFEQLESEVKQGSSKENRKTIELTLDDICKLISSVNISNSIGRNNENINNVKYTIDKVDFDKSTKDSKIPEEMLVGL